MSETVIVPPAAGLGRRRRGGPIMLLPLLSIPWLLYNLLAFTMFGGQPSGWATQLFQIRMVSGTEWSLTWGDIMLLIGIVALFFEVLKSTNTGRSSSSGSKAFAAVRARRTSPWPRIRPRSRL